MRIGWGWGLGSKGVQRVLFLLAYGQMLFQILQYSDATLVVLFCVFKQAGCCRTTVAVERR